MANAYDIIILMADAIEQGTDLKEFLYAVEDYDGAGGTLTIDENGDAIKDFQLMVIRNGEFVVYEG